jgi:hypothetical protein
LYRGSQIAGIFLDKADLMDSRGCSTNLRGDLAFWQSSLINSTSEDLRVLYPLSNNIENKNKKELCGIWDSGQTNKKEYSTFISVCETISDQGYVYDKCDIGKLVAGVRIDE